MKKAIISWSCSAWLESSSAVEAISSEAEAFCWMTRSSCWIALLICSAPESCSLLAALISCTSSAVFWMLGTITSSRSAAFSATSTLETESLLISPAAIWLRSASLRTSAATTAKPLPCSPARAASIAALRASRLVCRAISSMIMILLAISFIAAVVSDTAVPPSRASWAAWMAIFSVCRALSAFCRMLAVICSMELEASSAAAACSDAPCDISSEAALIAWLPEETLSVAALTWPMTSLRICTMFCRALPS